MLMTLHFPDWYFLRVNVIDNWILFGCGGSCTDDDFRISPGFASDGVLYHRFPFDIEYLGLPDVKIRLCCTLTGNLLNNDNLTVCYETLNMYCIVIHYVVRTTVECN